MIERTCQQCGKQFKAWPSRVKLGYGKFCSERCYYKALQGKPLIKATLKAAQVNKGRARSPEAIAKTVAGNKGKHRTNEQRQFLSYLAKQRVNKNFYGKHHSAKTKKRLSEAQQRNWQNPEYRMKQSQLVKLGWENNPEQKRHLSKIQKALWQNPEYREMTIEAALKGNRREPNRAELKLQNILDKHFPSEWKYTGNGYHTIGGFSPDFTNCNGRKEIIEVFGDYWHSLEVIRDRWQATELGKIMAYNSLGYRCLIIWEHELGELSEKEIVAKIKKFNGRKYAHATHP